MWLRWTAATTRRTRSLDDLGLDTFPAVNTHLSADDFENLSAFEDGDYVLITAVGDESRPFRLPKSSPAL